MLIDRSAPDTSETEQMIVIHRALQREFALLPRIVRSVDVNDVRRSTAVARHIRLLFALLHGHLHEEALLWPLLHQRARMNGAVIDAMEGRQQEIVYSIAWIDTYVERWRVDGNVLARNGLAVALGHTSALLTDCLDLRERDILPLIHEHLSVTEWKTPQRATTGRFPTGFRARRRLAGLVLEDASGSEKSYLISEMRPTDRLLWRLIGWRMYVRHIADIRGLVLT